MTEQPGWESPGRPPGEQPEAPRPPLAADWASEQPPPSGWGHPPGYGGSAGAGPQPGWGVQPAWLPPKPGVIPLRPLGVGEILDGAISTIRAKPRLMLGLSAILAVITQLITVPITWVLLHDAGATTFRVNQSNTGGKSDLALTASSLSASALQQCITLVATLLLTGILTIVLSRAVLGQDINGKQAWAQARPRLLALLGVTVMVFLIEIGVGVVLIGPGVALAVAGAPVIATALALLVGIPAFIVAAIYLYVAFALAPAVAVLEKQPVVASLTRSRRLVTGAWWRTFGILLLVNIIAAIASGVLGGGFLFASYLSAGLSSGFQDFNPYALVPLIVTAVGAILSAAITWPFTAVATALLYVDRRIRREGLDIELARAAGFTPPDDPMTRSTSLGGPAGYSAGAAPPPPYGG